MVGDCAQVLVVMMELKKERISVGVRGIRSRSWEMGWDPTSLPGGVWRKNSLQMGLPPWMDEEMSW